MYDVLGHTEQFIISTIAQSFKHPQLIITNTISCYDLTEAQPMRRKGYKKEQVEI